MKNWLISVLVLSGCEAPCEAVAFQPVTNDGTHEPVTLYACLHTPVRPRGAVILVHGLGGNSREWVPMARELVSHDVSALTIDLRGHGRSAGTFPTAHPDSFGIAASDVEGALDWLIEQAGVDSTRVVLVGASLGGGAVIATALERPWLRFVAWYPGLTYRWRGDSLVNARGSSRPGLIIQGTSDVHPRANPILSQRFISRNPGVGVVWIPGGLHGAGAERAKYEQVTMDTVRSWLTQ